MMRKKIALLIAMALVLTGCGSKKDSGNGGKTEVTGQVTDDATSENSTDDTTEENQNSIPFREKVDAMDIKDTWKQELLYAATMGFSLEIVDQDNINGESFCLLIDEFIGYVDPDKLPEWQTKCQGMREYDYGIKRIDAMAALFLAAQVLGGDYYAHINDIWWYAQSVNHAWDDNPAVFCTQEFYGDDWDKQWYNGSFGWGGLETAGFYYNCSRISPYSGECPFAVNEMDNSFDMEKDPTYADALLALIRLYFSANPELYSYTPNVEDREYLDMADVRREKIHSSTTDITNEVTGQIYYISNTGDDSNDGRSPETAWATPYRAMSESLSTEDAIMFERGGTWYIDNETNLGSASNNLEFGNGVDIGAYGEGEKPVLRGDIQEANDPGFWELYYDQDGKKIWKATKETLRPNVIVFDEGESWADNILPYWDGDKKYVNVDGSDFVVEESLKRDLTFCHLYDLEKYHDLFPNTDNTWKGELYLRCDAGNPAEVFDTVSVPQCITCINLLPESRMTDLDLRYFTMMAAHCTSNSDPDLHDNCGYNYNNLDIGWCGGFAQQYNWLITDIYQQTIAGGALGIYGSEVTVTGCYIHHCGPMAMILSMHDYTTESAETITYKDMYFSENLFEYCGAPLHWVDLSMSENPESVSYIESMIFEDNMVMNSGEGWIYESVLQSSAFGSGNSFWLSAIEDGMGAADNGGIYIRNNILYISKYSLITICHKVGGENERPVNREVEFSGNTYVQLQTRPLIQEPFATYQFYPNNDEVKEYINDPTGTYISLWPGELVEE